MSWMRSGISASNERRIWLRNIYRQAYLLHGELGQAKQNLPSIEVFVKPRRQVRRIPVGGQQLLAQAHADAGIGICLVPQGGYQVRPLK
jgi:hypothetical protein